MPLEKKTHTHQTVVRALQEPSTTILFFQAHIEALKSKDNCYSSHTWEKSHFIVEPFEHAQ
jgi:hypothetical protein